MPDKAVLLLSGGLDSATCGAIAKNRGFALYAMSFRYGQRHAVEVDAARRAAGFLGAIEHRIVDIDLRSFGHSALTTDAPVPKGRDPSVASGIPATYVPARNTIFLSYAVGWAEVLDCRDIFIGVNAVDYSGYPDCRPEYIDAFERMANLATRAGVEGKKLTLHAPLIGMTKAEIIRAGSALGLDYGTTHSCYDPDGEGRACGACDSCVIRRRGFLEAGVPDPTKYAEGRQ
jgi:7-cyano-7-deazaguanine synthase